ncbi:hypothetical protein BATR1942_09060 [Bacillus atrophaeus 1942]|uniref:Uncharacterized protein n=1 Tax=Bacillus atrophaeus (strain 1942) TaxID=720555 RepID=A0ABM5LYD9_BACA1|nr:hypothetical protein BATR1942_09060 [Bacillus atrophaeus 1942]EIM11795.1 hypothetical protein UY9_04302 [Bacillus atrophaeus C89]
MSRAKQNKSRKKRLLMVWDKDGVLFKKRFFDAALCK